MKTRSIKKITGLIALAVCGAVIIVGLNGEVHTGVDVSALSYSTASDVSFTFAPKLSISLSDTNLVIDTLTPGTTSTSNPITITVGSNTPYGYSLYADAGSNDTESIYYNTSDLVHNDTTTDFTPSFTSIATNASLTTLDTDNTWGYSTSTDNGTTWSTYNGLPTATSTESSTSTNNPALLIDTKDPADSSKSIDFKIAARSSSTQPSGTYSNIINFYAVGKPEPIYMQDVATWGSTLEIGDEITAVDARDGQEYTVARLEDGNIWMTKNLNLAGGTVITSELSNVLDGYTLPTANGFQSGNKLPASSTSGFNDDTKAFVYNSTKTSGTDCTSPGCYSYYSWTAATAGSGISIASSDTDAPYSICPKGWKLPNSRSTASGNSDFYQLAVAYGMPSSSTSESTSNFYSQAGPGTTPNFLLAGSYYNGSFYGGGSLGLYWSSTSSSSTLARVFYFNASYVGSADVDDRRGGSAVRCIAE